MTECIHQFKAIGAAPKNRKRRSVSRVALIFVNDSVRKFGTTEDKKNKKNKKTDKLDAEYGRLAAPSLTWSVKLENWQANFLCGEQVRHERHKNERGGGEEKEKKIKSNVVCEE